MHFKMISLVLFATVVNLDLAERSVNVVENPVNSQMKDRKSRSAREREKAEKDEEDAASGTAAAAELYAPRG